MSLTKWMPIGIVPMLLGISATAFGQGVPWRIMPLAQALDEAAATGQMILLDVRSDHCGQCKVMEGELWANTEGAAFAEGMIPLKYESGSQDGIEAHRRYPITGLPVVIFIRPDGSELDRVVGYDSKEDWLEEARPLKEGIDPLPAMEADLAAHPDSVQLMLPVLERYLFRYRDVEARKLLDRMIQHDPANRTGKVEIAIVKLAKHESLVRNNPKASMDLWRMLLERFPNASSAGAAVDGTFKAASSLNEVAQWKEWIAGLAEKYPTNGRILYAIAMTASRNGMRDVRFAKAARSAKALGVGGAFLDSIAVKLEPNVKK